MTVYTLRPNGDVSNSGSWAWTLSSGTSFSNLLKDDHNHTTEVTSTGQSDRFITMSLDAATGLIPGGERIVAVRAFCEYYDDRNYALPSNATFPAEIGLYCAGYGTQYGAQYVSLHGTSHVMTFQGPRITSVPTRPDIPLSHALVDGMNIVIHSRISTNFYGVWVEVETTTDGTVDVTVPTGTTTNRGPVVQWAYSMGQARQSRALVKIFTDAQYGVGGFNPFTATPFVQTDLSGSAASWQTYIAPSELVAARGTPLPDDTYRAYVWVQDSGVNNWIGPDYVTFTVADPVNVPTMMVPTDLSSTSTSNPALIALQTSQAGGARVRLEFEVASEVTFTNDLQTMLEDVSLQRISGTGAVIVPVALAQGNWNWRVRSKDEYGTYSSWSATRTFTVAHAPASSNWTPSLGVSTAYGTGNVVVSWSFTDLWSEDSQSAYQVRVWAGSDPTTYLYDSGVTISTDLSYEIVALDTAYKDVDLYWQVRVRDQDSVWSVWSAANLFHVSDIPTVTITAPSNGATVTTPTPTVAWTFTASGGRTQSAWRVFVTNTDTSTVIFDNGWTTGTETSFTPALPIIDLLTNYSVTVQLKDNNGLTGSDTNAFDADYILPDAVTFTLSATTYATTGLVQVDWSGATEDGNFYAWRVYRRNTGDTTWTLIASTASGVLAWADYLSPNDTDVEYAVVQAISTFGLIIETVYEPQATIGTTEKYFLVCPGNNALNLCLYHVTSDNFDDEIEQAVVNAIGRGRRIEKGTRYGKTGSLDVSFYDNDAMTARQQRLAMDALRESGYPIYLRNPFGDVWEVGVMSMPVTRIPGVGMREFAKASISYMEITA